VDSQKEKIVLVYNLLSAQGWLKGYDPSPGCGCTKNHITPAASEKMHGGIEVGVAA
jgi:hypothetical protein